MKTVISRNGTVANPYSIQWRLAASYAGIALLAALALGGLLLFTLRSYYDMREREYMEASTDVIAHSVERLYQDREALDLPEDVLQSAANIYSFVILARVRLMDVNHTVIADSDTLSEGNFISVDVREPPGGWPNGELPPTGPDGEFQTYLSIRREELILPEDVPAGEQIARQYPILTRRSPFGRLLDGSTTSSDDHTDLILTVPVYAPGPNRELLGYLELSEGPAFGSEIVREVAEKAAVAGMVAILLAALAGWFVSRNISQPVLALTHTTGQMAEGDLAARVDLDRRDEFGLLARSFNMMAERVENTVVMLRRFVADAAHEINTPITALRTNLELARSEKLPGDSLVDIDHALNELVRLEMLTHGLLTLARLETPVTETARDPVDLAAVVRQLHECYASRADQVAISLAVEVPHQPVTIRANREQITRAIENLLDNALKFTPSGGTVTLSLEIWPDQARVIVTDTGIGIPDDDLPKLFSRFHRGRNAAAYSGNGLGLVITKAIIEEHGGQIHVQSDGEGTRFVVDLARNGEVDA